MMLAYLIGVLQWELTNSTSKILLPLQQTDLATELKTKEENLLTALTAMRI